MQSNSNSNGHGHGHGHGRNHDTVYLTFSTSVVRNRPAPTSKKRAKFTVRTTVKAALAERDQMRNYGYGANTYEVRRSGDSGEFIAGNGMRIRVK